MVPEQHGARTAITPKREPGLSGVSWAELSDCKK